MISPGYAQRGKSLPALVIVQKLTLCLLTMVAIRESLTARVNEAHFRTLKLPTHGGAIGRSLRRLFFILCIWLTPKECYPSRDPRWNFLNRLKPDGGHISTLVADGGVLTNSMFQILTTKIETMCQQ